MWQTLEETILVTHLGLFYIIRGMVAIGTYHIPLKAHKYPIGTYENLILVI